MATEPRRRIGTAPPSRSRSPPTSRRSRSTTCAPFRRGPGDHRAPLSRRHTARLRARLPWMSWVRHAVGCAPRCTGCPARTRRWRPRTCARPRTASAAPRSSSFRTVSSACVCGTLRSVTLRPRAGVPALVAELYDGSGTVQVVWLGRRQIAGHPGRSPDPGARPDRPPRRRPRAVQPELRAAARRPRMRRCASDASTAVSLVLGHVPEGATTVEEVVRHRLVEGVGGLRGSIEAALPTVAFVVVWTTTQEPAGRAGRQRRDRAGDPGGPAGAAADPEVRAEQPGRGRHRGVLRAAQRPRAGRVPAGHPVQLHAAGGEPAVRGDPVAAWSGSSSAPRTRRTRWPGAPIRGIVQALPAADPGAVRDVRRSGSPSCCRRTSRTGSAGSAWRRSCSAGRCTCGAIAAMGAVLLRGHTPLDPRGPRAAATPRQPGTEPHSIATG